MPSETPPPSFQVETMTRVQVLLAIAMTAVILLVVTQLWMRLGQVTLFPTRSSLKAVLWGLAFALGISGASSLVYHLWPQYRQSADYYLKLVIEPLSLPDILWLGLLPGLSEELLFRGVMLPEFGRNWEGIVISSLCFGALHMSNRQQLPYVAWATVVGGILGFSAVWSGNLLVPIVAHVSTNLISGFLWKWKNRGTGAIDV
jgi:uncharacterized protein